MVWIISLIAITATLVALVVTIGSMLPRVHHVSRRAHFNFSPVEIWEIITDYAGQASWRTDVRRVERLPDRNGHPVWRETDRRGQALEIESVESVAPLWLVRCIVNENLAFGGSWTYELGEYGEVTSVTVTEDGEVYKPVFRFINRFIIGQTATIDAYLRALAKRLGVDVTITSV
jgi:hypothetical protein